MELIIYMPQFIPGRGMGGITQHQDYNVVENTTHFITTSNTFQECCKFIFTVAESGLYKFTWLCFGSSKVLSFGENEELEGNIEMDVKFNGVEIPCNCQVFENFLSGAFILSINSGENIFSMFIRSLQLGKEIKFIYSRLEYNRIYN